MFFIDFILFKIFKYRFIFIRKKKKKILKVSKQEFFKNNIEIKVKY